MSEGWLGTGGGRLRYVETGDGPALVHLAATGELTPAHTLLGRRFRVIVLDTPERGLAPSAVLGGLATLGVERFSLLGSAMTVNTALDVALAAPERVLGLVLESPRSIGAGADLAALGMATCLLCGTLDAEAAPAARRCAALIPNAHLVFVYAAGRTIAHDRPEAFAEVVGDFLERHEAFVISRATTVIHP